MPDTDAPQVGDRVWNRYDLQWGTVTKAAKDPYATEGWDCWYEVREDRGKNVLLNWPQRMVPESDPRAGR